MVGWVVVGEHRCWFQRREGIDIVGDLERLMWPLEMGVRNKGGKEFVVVEWAHILRNQCLPWKEVRGEGIENLCRGDLFDCHTIAFEVAVYRL